MATILVPVAAASVLAGCGGEPGSERLRVAAGAAHERVLAWSDGLPEGHPPVGPQYGTLPQGHPPVTGQRDGLPPGHPVCPAGRRALEGILPGGGDDTTEPETISI